MMMRQQQVQLIDSLKYGSRLLLATALFYLQVGMADASDSQVQKILALQADSDYGEYLAGECVTCHKRTGESTGVPHIAGLPADQIVTALLAFRSGTRENQVMQGVAGSLGDEEIASLALFFSTMQAN